MNLLIEYSILLIYTFVGNSLKNSITSIMNNSNTDEEDETTAGNIISSSDDWNASMVFICLSLK